MTSLTHPRLVETIAEARQLLDTRGWAVVVGLPQERAQEFVRELGPLLRQYNGATSHTVAPRPEYADRQYSQSANGIRPHTEAPGRNRPPRYIALHCHRQARCGGGHTMLADGYGFLARLSEDLADAARKTLISFPTSPVADGPVRRIPMVTETQDARVLVRYSYNVLRYGQLDPPLVSDNPAREVDQFATAMMRLGGDFFESHSERVLGADGSLLLFDNHRMIHGRHRFRDLGRSFTRYWIGESS